MLQLGKPYNGATDCRILPDGTRIRFTEQSLFEVTFPDGHQESWDPAQPPAVCLPVSTAIPKDGRCAKPSA